MTTQDTTSAPASINWADWLARWEVQQAIYIPRREDRFDAMFDLVESLASPDCTIIDLACGPGAISRRAAERFPGARIIAIDLDPVLLAIGRNAIGDADGRITWLEADLSSPDWLQALPVTQVDAVLSTTAIHWLGAGRIVQLYEELAQIIRPGGAALNGDTMNYTPNQPRFLKAASDVRAAHQAASVEAGAEDWEEWWLALRKETTLADLFAERDRRFGWRSAEREQAIGSAVDSGHQTAPQQATWALHHAAMLNAGFSEVDTVWQAYSNRVIAAIR